MNKIRKIATFLSFLICATILLGACPISSAEGGSEDFLWLSEITHTSYYGEKAPVLNTDMKGETITFADGKTFSKGISFSCIWDNAFNGYYAGAVYDISNYSYNHFSTTVGSLTDYVNNDVELIYTVFADNVPICATQAYKHADGSHEIEAIIPAGTQNLEIRVQSQPHNFAATVSFADAKLDTVEVDPEDDCVYLNDLTPLSYYGEGEPMNNTDRKGNPITFSDNKVFVKGVSFSAKWMDELGGYYAGAVYDISQYDYDRLTTTVGSLTDYINAEVKMSYTIFADGIELIRTEYLMHVDGSLPIKVIIPEGTQKLEIRVQSLPHNFAATIAFADAKLYNASAEDLIFEKTIVSDFVETPVTVDGVISDGEYSKGEIFEVNPKKSQYIINNGVEKHNLPSSIKQYLNWDNDNLYVATQIKLPDGALNPDYIDLSIYPNLYNKISYNKYQLSLNDGKVINTTDGLNKAENFSFKVTSDTTTVTYELIIPLSSLVYEISVTHGKNIGLLNQVNWDDSSIIYGVININEDMTDYDLPSVMLSDIKNAVVYLSDLPFKYEGDGIRGDANFLDAALATDDDRVYNKGVAVSAKWLDSTEDFRCIINYDLSQYTFDRFASSVGSLTDHISTTLQYQFIAYADGVEIVKTQPLWHNDGSVDFLVKIPEGTETLSLHLITTPNNVCGTAVWGNARIYTAKTDDSVDDIAAAVAAIDKVIQNQGEANITAARELFDALDETAQENVHNAKWLFEAEEKLAYSKFEAENKAKAGEVDELISAIDPDNIEADKLSVAQDAYNALNDTQKKLVKKLFVLKSAQKSFAAAADKTVVQSVIDMINSVKANNSSAISAAREAYNALTASQKQLVTNISKLYYLEENPDEFSYTNGDIDLNGSITAADALLVLQAAVKKITLDGSLEPYADVDGNAGITAGDALVVLQRAVNKIDKFPVED